MVLWEHPFERYLALVSLVIIAVSLSVIAVKRLTEPPAVILQEPSQPAKSAQLSLKVHIKGAVKKPGVYSLPYGSRVEDALNLAQPKTTANLDALNLAGFLEDGQEVIVPARQQKVMSPAPSILVPKTNTTSRQTLRAKTPRIIVHLNSATEADLIQLPGIGPKLAKRILEYRRQIGGFLEIEQLLEVKGIGPKKFEQIRSYIRL